jgi:hypothetical protein
MDKIIVFSTPRGNSWLWKLFKDNMASRTNSSPNKSDVSDTDN